MLACRLEMHRPVGSVPARAVGLRGARVRRKQAVDSLLTLLFHRQTLRAARGFLPDGVLRSLRRGDLSRLRWLSASRAA